MTALEQEPFPEETVSEDNPLEPYSGAPLPHIDVPLDALTTAHAYFVNYYQDRPELVRSADRALDALKTRPWSILENGDLEIAGSGGTTYISSGAACIKKGVVKTNRKTGRHGVAYCPSYSGGHAGRCYHQTAREIVRLAHVLMGATT